MHKIIELYLIVFRFWMRFPEKIRFLLVGGYNTVFSYLLYVSFLYLFTTCLSAYITEAVAPQVALFLSFALSSINSYLTQKFYVFNTRGHYMTEYVRCLGSWGINYLLNMFLLWLFTTILAVNPYLAQLIIAIILTVTSYVLLKYFAFRKREKN